MLVPITIALFSCNTTRKLKENQFLLESNEVILPEKKDIIRSQQDQNNFLRLFISRTEQNPAFEWFYSKVDDNVDAAFWKNLRTPPDSTEVKFLTSLEEQELLYPVLNESELTYGLSNHIIQKPNQSNFKLWLHQSIDPETDSKFWKSVKNNIAEPPVILDTASIERSVESMDNYLYSKGYFDSGVDYLIRTKNRKAIIRYYAYGLKPYYIKSYRINSFNETLGNILENAETKSFLQQGEILRLGDYDKEVVRITNELRNNGYANFSPNFISKLRAEKTDSLDISLDILRPSDTTGFKQFYNGKIEIYHDINQQSVDSAQYKSYERGDISLFYRGNKVPIKPSSLWRRISMEPEELYSQREVDYTKQRLNNLGMYKFVYINSINDTSNSEVLNYRIYLQSLDKISVGYDIDLHTASNSSLNRGLLFGTTFRTNLRNRNAFRGGETWNTLFELGLELAQRTEQTPSRINSFNLKVQNDFKFPELRDWNGTWSILEALTKKNENIQSKLQQAKNFGKSNISVGYDYKEQINFFQTNLFSASMGFQFQNNKWITDVDQMGIYYFAPQTRQLFDSIVLEPNPGYRNSFVNQLFTGVVLNQIRMNFQKTPNRFGESYTFEFFTEFSGLEIMATESIYNAISGRNDEFLFFNDIQYARFMKFSTSGSYLREFESGRAIGIRVSTGILIPLEENSPFVKQFFVGGANSVRAWQERDLGPGTFQSEDEDGILPYQVGDFKFDIMSEVRFPIWGYFKGALFLDAGNIWAINDNDNREGGQLETDFYKEIAVGTGLGLRLDIELAVIRLDIGQKIRNPYINEETGNRWAIQNFSDISFGNFNYNLALGYPF
ncbi:MAG TPA: BamA/TamA family outer membrane protein [Saprospiraceae bacterium]|nr:BamA/TamA family outer membrane protein [Saprospiraceae bacterium]